MVKLSSPLKGEMSRSDRGVQKLAGCGAKPCHKNNVNGTRVKLAFLLVLSRRGSVDVWCGVWYNKLNKLEFV